MSLWRTLQLLAVAAIGVQAEATVSNRTSSLEAVSILGGSAPGNVAACYAPFHNAQYPLFGGAADVNALRAAIEDDFRLMAKYFTHVKTYYSQHYGIELAPIAKKYGLKLYLGVYMTKESWMNDEIKAAANAIKQYSDTVEVVLAGNENMVNFQTHSWEIIDVVNRVKSAAGGDAWRVKYGTVQRITEYMDNSFNGEVQQLKDSLDILGVNIYPFFNNNYDGNNPTALLDAQWKAVTAKWGRDKFRLTETGFPTAGAPSSLSPRVQPSLDNSFKYYEGLLNWWPQGSEAYPKFWFQAFDRRYGDPAAPVDLERYFGFFTTEKWTKRDNYPRLIGSSTGSSCTIENGVDYAGNDITSASASRAEVCFAICNAQSGCSAFTWTSYNGGTCWLKSGKGATSSNSDARSAITCRCNLGGLEPSVDYVGNDIGSAAEASAEDCIGACQRFNGCRVFSWNGYAGGTCYLKSGKGATTSNSAVVSGVIC